MCTHESLYCFTKHTQYTEISYMSLCHEKKERKMYICMTPLQNECVCCKNSYKISKKLI